MKAGVSALILALGASAVLATAPPPPPDSHDPANWASPPPPPDSHDPANWASPPPPPLTTPTPLLPPRAPASPSAPPAIPPVPLSPPANPTPFEPPSAPSPLPPPPPEACNCDEYMQGAKEKDSHFCYKVEKATKYCVPPIWVGEGKMRKTDVADRAPFFKCGASDWELCIGEVVVPSPTAPPVPPSPPAPTWPPTPPTMPGKVFPNAPPLPPGTNIVPCVDTMAQKKCVRKAQKGKCWMAKVYTKCAATCKRTCVAP